MTPEEIERAERRLAAKRSNERLKLAVTSINAVALTVLGGALVLPGIAGASLQGTLPWIPLAILLHFFAQYLLRFLKGED